MRPVFFALLLAIVSGAQLHATGTTIGWIGAGGHSSVLAGDKDSLPVSDKEKYSTGETRRTGAILVFMNSLPAAQGSIEIKYDQKNGETLEGKASWVGWSIPMPSWSSVNIKKMNVLQFCIKNLPQECRFRIALQDASDKTTGNLLSSKYITEAKDWARVTIPLSDFPEIEKIDLTKIVRINFGAESEGAFKLFFDDVFFDAVKGASSKVKPWHQETEAWEPKREDLAKAPRVAIHVDPTVSVHPISPFIYGAQEGDSVIFKYLRAHRWGGNASSRFNWKSGVSNSGKDGGFKNGKFPLDWDRFRRLDGALLTIPTIGWVAKDDFSVSTVIPERDESLNAPLSHPAATKPLETSIKVGPDYMAQWVQAMKKTGPTPKFYSMDNEPELWGFTQRDVHGWQCDYDELWDHFASYSKAVKDADPKGLITGPDPCNWYFYFNTRWNYDVNSKAKYGGLDYIPWFLKKCRERDLGKRRRYLDVLDFHYYPLEFDTEKTDEETNLKRFNAVRALYDPGYAVEMGNGVNKENVIVNLIPRFRQWVDNYYPGTRLALTEYYFGALHHIAGALVQADILGTLGREGVFAAFLAGSPKGGDPGTFAFRMFTDYDDQGHSFGDVSIKAEAEDISSLSTYASLDSKTGDLLLMVINKRHDGAVVGKISMDHYHAAKAQVFNYSENDPDNVLWYPDLKFQGSSFEYVFPGYSITLLRLKR